MIIESLPESVQTMLVVLAVVATVVVGVPAFVWILRRASVGRRVVVSLVAFFVAGALALGRAELYPDAETPLLSVTVFLLGVNAGLHLIELLVWEVLLRRWLHIEMPRLLLDLLIFIGLATAAFIAFISLSGDELSVTDVLVTSTVISAVLGLALQPVLSNLFSGLALHVESPFETRDWVMIRGQEGQIVEMGWRTTTLRTRDNHFITVPNGEVASHDIINFNAPSRLQALNEDIGVAYWDPPARVKEVLIAAAMDVPGVRTAPRPVVYCEGFGDFAIKYRLKYWITDYGRMPELRDAVMTNAYYRLKRNGMTIPFPIRDVRVRPPPDEETVAAERKEAIRSTLRQVDLLAPLSDPQVDTVAAGSRLAWYAPGEHIVTQAAAGDSMFIVREGAVRVQVASPDLDEPVDIAERGPGDLFGEMSLLTGEARSATVVAADETQVVEVDKAAVGDVLLADPRIAEALSEVLAARRADTTARLEHEASRQAAEAPSAQDLLGRIRAFFAVDG